MQRDQPKMPVEQVMRIVALATKCARVIYWAPKARKLRQSAFVDVDDLSQECALKAWRVAANFDPARGTELVFARTIAKNVLRDRLKYARASNRDVTGDSIFELDAVSCEPEAREILHDRRRDRQQIDSDDLNVSADTIDGRVNASRILREKIFPRLWRCRRVALERALVGAPTSSVKQAMYDARAVARQLVAEGALEAVT